MRGGNDDGQQCPCSSKREAVGSNAIMKRKGRHTLAQITTTRLENRFGAFDVGIRIRGSSSNDGVHGCYVVSGGRLSTLAFRAFRRLGTFRDGKETVLGSSAAWTFLEPGQVEAEREGGVWDTRGKTTCVQGGRGRVCEICVW